MKEQIDEDMKTMEIIIGGALTVCFIIFGMFFIFGMI